jgi:hypothetical protein
MLDVFNVHGKAIVEDIISKCILVYLENRAVIFARK